MTTPTTPDAPEPRQRPAESRENGATAAGWLQLLRARLGMPGGLTLRDTLEAALKGADNAEAFSVEEREMLLRILRFGALRVDDVMVPRADIIAIDENEPIHELLATFDQAGVSRIPLFRETLDDPRGMVHIKDLMHWIMADVLGRPLPEARGPATATAKAAPPSPLVLAEKDSAGATVKAIPNLGRADLTRTIASAKLRRPVLYVPASMPAMNLLIRMQSTRNHMALVVDEYGGTDGLVTIEDLVEQIVGDIEDEHDEAEAANIVADPKHGLLAAARTPVKELEAHLGMTLLTPDEEEEIDTLGGLVFHIVGRVPTRGELIRHPSGLELEVLDADPRRVKKLKIHLARANTTPPSA